MSTLNLFETAQAHYDQFLARGKTAAYFETSELYWDDHFIEQELDDRSKRHVEDICEHIRKQTIRDLADVLKQQDSPLKAIIIEALDGYAVKQAKEQIAITQKI